MDTTQATTTATTKTYRTIRGQAVRGEQQPNGQWIVKAYANGEWVRACTNYTADTEQDCNNYIATNLQWLHS